MEPDVAETQRRPCNQPCNGAETHEPSECLCRATGAQTEVCEGPEKPRRDDGNVGHAVLPGSPEDLWELAVRGHGDDHAGSDPAVRVACRPRRYKNAGVDDRRKCHDACLLDGDDPGRGVGISGIRNKAGIPGIDDETDEKSAEDVEQGDSIRDSSGGLGDGRVGIYALGSGDDHHLDANEGERCVDKGGQESQEVARGPGNAIVVDPRTRIVPVAEASRLAIRCASRCDDDGYYDESKEACNLDCTGDDFGLAKPAHVHQVDGKNEDKTDGDDNGRRHVSPIPHENRRSRAFGSNRYRVTISIADGQGETDSRVDEAARKVRKRTSSGNLTWQ